MNKLCEKITYIYPTHDGPNCWNATLLYHGYPRIEYVTEYDMELWLERCTKPVKKLHRGDVLVMRCKLYNRLEHTAIWVEDNRYWHKPNLSRRSMWEYATLERLQDLYPECSLEYRRVKK